MKKPINAADKNMQAQLKKELLSSKINLGADRNNYDTTYLSEHNEKGYCKDHGKSEEIKKDLRATHYQLGYGDVTDFNG